MNQEFSAYHNLKFIAAIKELSKVDRDFWKKKKKHLTLNLSAAFVTFLSIDISIFLLWNIKINPESVATVFTYALDWWLNIAVSIFIPLIVWF